MRWLLLGAACAWAGICVAPAWAKPGNCLDCHATVARGAFVHAPAHDAQGCEACHGALNDATTPHEGMGRYGKGLVAPLPALCHDCHEKKDFAGRNVHGPAASGDCLVCHTAHASNEAGLLARETSRLCIGCHEDIPRRPHVIASFSGGGHPLGGNSLRAPVADPLRRGKTFSCASCHEPHRSEHGKLLRPGAYTSIDFCTKCHPK